MTWRRDQRPRQGPRRRILERDGHVCHWCGREATEADHVLARVLGGDTSDDNYVASCKSCNSRRGAQVRNRMTAVHVRHPYFP